MTMNNATPARDVDAVVVGAGFSGLYGTKRLLDLGLKVRAFDSGPRVGGVWNWNSYPGARTDSLAESYQFSTDREFANAWEYMSSNPRQAEVLGYLRKFADHYRLHQHYTFDTTVVSAHYDDAARRWTITTSSGETVRATWFIPAMGLVSAPNLPDVPGFDTFAGEVVHTSRWPDGGVEFAGRRVAVIGTGSSGVQLITTIAPEVASLAVFQRTPNWVVPTGARELSAQDRAALKADFDNIWSRIRQHPAAWPWKWPERGALDVSAEERERVFEAAWKTGGFSPLYGVFHDVGSDVKANDLAREWLTRKIRSLVRDPAIAAALTPSHPYGTKRPPSGDGWYEVFNRANVSLVDLRQDPIVKIDAQGIVTAKGRHDVDVIVLATGFDAITGAFTRVDIRGSGGRELRELWAPGPDTYLGIAVHGYPNMFMIAGPHTPAGNLPPGAQEQTEWIVGLIQEMRRRGAAPMEPTAEAQRQWNQRVFEAGEASLLRFGKSANSWFTGSNIDGKAFSYLLFFGGANIHADLCDEEAARGYPGFREVS